MDKLTRDFCKKIINLVIVSNISQKYDYFTLMPVEKIEIHNDLLNLNFDFISYEELRIDEYISLKCWSLIKDKIHLDVFNNAYMFIFTNDMLEILSEIEKEEILENLEIGENSKKRKRL